MPDHLRPAHPAPPPARKPFQAPAPRELAPDVQPREAERLHREIQASLQQTERRVGRLDPAALTPDQRDALATVRSFLGMAKEALERRDYPAASNLAEKARVLAEELPRPTP